MRLTKEKLVKYAKEKKHLIHQKNPQLNLTFIGLEYVYKFFVKNIIKMQIILTFEYLYFLI